MMVRAIKNAFIVIETESNNVAQAGLEFHFDHPSSAF